MLRRWSPRKRDWCCFHESRGCLEDVPSVSVATSSEPYDCQAGYSLPSRTWWSEAKRDWCCKSHHIDCPTKAPPVVVWTTTTLRVPQSSRRQKAYDCKDGPAWYWPQEKQFWCCFYQTIGCWPSEPVDVPATTFPLAPTTTTTYFQCFFADWNVERRMTAAEKKWCCQHRGYGCPTTTTSTSFVLITMQERNEATNSTNASVNTTTLSDSIQDIRNRFAPMKPAWIAEDPGYSQDQTRQALNDFFPQMKFNASHVRLAWSQRTWTIAMASAACALCALRALLARPSPRSCCCHFSAKLQALLDNLQPRSRRCAGYLQLDAAAAALDSCGEAALQHDGTEA